MSNKSDALELLSCPGDSIGETIEHMEMTQSELAHRMRWPLTKIRDLLKGKEPITIDTAHLLEAILGIDASFWINREELYRKKLAEINKMEE